MVASNVDRVIIFEGDVVLKREDFTLTADRLEVTLSPPDPEKGPGDKGREPFLGEMTMGKEGISLIEAVGNVQIVQGTRSGKADRAVYDQKEEIVVLTGEPEVWEEGYRVSGTKMTFFLREQRNVVENSKAIVHPK